MPIAGIGQTAAVTTTLPYVSGDPMVYAREPALAPSVFYGPDQGGLTQPLPGTRTIGDTADTPGVHGPSPDILGWLTQQADPHDPDLGPNIVVNPREFGVTGRGDWNCQQFQSAHTNALVTNDSAEQGFGMGPERAWAVYPSPDMPNPFRNKNALQRAGGDGYSDMIYRPEVTAYWAQALGYQVSQIPVKQRASGYPTVNQHPSVPYVSTIPSVPPSPVNPGGYY